MQKIEIFEAARLVIDIANKVLMITSRPFNSYDPLPEEDQKIIDEHWQEISRISAEQAAKPEIQGYSEHE